MLGYKSYHAAELHKTPPGTHSLWLEALHAKYSEEGKRYRKQEFDKLIGEYDVGCIPYSSIGTMQFTMPFQYAHHLENLF